MPSKTVSRVISVFMCEAVVLTLGLFFSAPAAHALTDTQSFVSQVRDAGRAVDFTTISWTDDVPAGTTVAVYMKAGNTSAPDGTWTNSNGWGTALAKGGSISAYDGNQYFQYKVDLTSTDTLSATPGVQDVTVNWQSDISGTYTSGTGASNVLDAGSAVAGWGTFSWNATASGGRNATGITMQVRTSSTSEFSKAWCSVNNGDDLDALAAGSCSASIGPHERYIQYQATLISSAPYLETPYLNDVTVSYYKYDTADNVLVSSPFNTMDATTAVNRIFWTNVGADSNAKFQLRTAPDSNGTPNWGAGSGWCGPTTCDVASNGTPGGVANYFTAAGLETKASQRDGSGDQWLQYALFEKSADGTVTPELASVTIEYQHNEPPVVKATAAVLSGGNLTVNYNLNSQLGDETAANVQLFYYPLGVTLSADITSGTTGSVAIANPNSATIPASGYVLLSNELVHFNSSTSTSLNVDGRAQNFASGYPTVAAAHSAGVPVYFLSSAATGDVGTITALSGSPLFKSIAWTGAGATLSGTEILKVAANDGQSANNIGADIISLRQAPSFKNYVRFRSGVQLKNDSGGGTCDGDCDARVANGQSCTSDSGCQSGNCDRDFDTAQTYCHATSSGCVDYSLGTPWERATGHVLCNGNNYYNLCTGSVWGNQVNNPYPDYCDAGGGTQSGYYTSAAVCTGGVGGGFNTPACASCSPYKANTTSTCKTSCTGDSDCWSGYNCISSVCYASCNASTSCGTPCAFNGLVYGTVSANGQCWLDRNLGASRAATAYNDSQAYGWYFQWGRLVDGHQISNSGTTVTLSSSDTPGHDNFITSASSPFDWRSPQNGNLWGSASGYINNPCPSGWHVPAQAEWSSVVSALGITNYTTAYSSALKLTAAGRRGTNASLELQDSYGQYWSSSPYGSNAYLLSFYSSVADPASYDYRIRGRSVRCVKN